MARRNTLRKIGKTIAIVSLILLGAVVGYYSYMNQEVITYYIEKTIEFFTGNATTGEWLHSYVKASATFKAPRYALKGVTLSKSQLVYLINSTKVTNYIQFKVSVTINYQNLQSVSVNCKIKSRYIDENDQLQIKTLLDNNWNPSASGQSHDFTYQLTPGSGMWSSLSGYDNIFYFEVTASGTGVYSGESYSDSGGATIVSGTIQEAEESFSATASGSYSISSFIEFSIASFVLSNYSSLVIVFIAGVFIGIIIVAFSPVKPDFDLRAKVIKANRKRR